MSFWRGRRVADLLSERHELGVGWERVLRARRRWALIVCGSIAAVMIGVISVIEVVMDRPTATVTTCDSLVAGWDELDRAALSPAQAAVQSGQRINGPFVSAQINAYVAGVRQQLGGIADGNLREVWRQVLFSGTAAAAVLARPTSDSGSGLGSLQQLVQSGRTAADRCSAVIAGSDDDVLG